jgi:hypothetical protein
MLDDRSDITDAFTENPIATMLYMLAAPFAIAAFIGWSFIDVTYRSLTK